MRVVVGISGASGTGVAVRLLQLLAAAEVEVHLIVSRWGAATLKHETGLVVRDLGEFVHTTHHNEDLAAPISSGTFPVDAVTVAPCSARSLGSIAAGTGDTLISRVADVALKERRRLVLALRETPLSTIHLRNALEVSRAGGTIYPLMPAFYGLPTSVDDIVNDMAERIAGLCGVALPNPMIWGEHLDLNSQPGWRQAAEAPEAARPQSSARRRTQ